MKKGFTLIELLAVIVILAILAVIATPVILNIIDDSKKNAAYRSAENYLDSVNYARAQYLQINPDFKPSICLIQADGNLQCDYEHYLKIDAKGEIPNGGTIIFEDNNISKVELTYEKTVLVLDESKKIKQTQDFGSNSSINVVYFDVLKGEVCSLGDYNLENSKTGYNGINNKNSQQNSCLKFYKILETENTIDLILDHNTTAKTYWNSSGTFLNGPNEVINQLNSDTELWKGTIEPSNFTLEHENGSYTINYDGYKARLITAQELANITGHTSWVDGAGGYFYFDTYTQEENSTCSVGDTTECKYGWLYDRTSQTCKSSGCFNNSDDETYGYWTASSYFPLNSNTPAHVEMCQGYVSYGVSYLGRMGVVCVNNGEHYGVRPVITISK